LKCLAKEPNKDENIQIFTAGNKKDIGIHNRRNKYAAYRRTQCFTKKPCCDMKEVDFSISQHDIPITTC
jgi:hypothetical protein